MPQVVCDTGPILHLQEIGRLELLSHVGRIRIPPAVDQELEQHIAGWKQRKPDWIEVHPLSTASNHRAGSWQAADILHSGEAQSLALALQVRCDWYLTDDAAARVCASSLDLEVHGTLGVVLWAAAKNKLNSSEGELVIEELVGISSLWISPRIVAEAKAALAELTSR